MKCNPHIPVFNFPVLVSSVSPAPGSSFAACEQLRLLQCKASPSDGTIRIVLNPTKEAKVDDLIQIRAELDGQGVEYEQCFWVRIVDEEKPKETTKKEEETKQENFGLPQPKLVYQEKKEGFVSWEGCGKATQSHMRATYNDVVTR